jgi:beta-lactamase regulating signal transducer with metallopeptidase domain
MGELIIYIMKSSICLAAFYLFYKLLLTKETFHRFNRMVLILIFTLAAIIPFIELSLRSDSAISDLSLNLDNLMAMIGEAQANSTGGQEESVAPVWIKGLIILYVTGLIITVLFSLVSFLRMYLLLKRSGTKRSTIDNNITLIIHNEQISPFSWMKYIALNEKDYTENGREIIAHEMAHIKGIHSLDILIAELMKTVHWFNPAAWLLKQEIRNIHEFQADEAVIKNGIDAKQYQLLLIKKAVGDRLYTMANSFNHSKLKNRITMITKKKSNRRASLKALFVLPLTLFAVILFANEKVTSALEPVSNIKINDLIQKDTTKVSQKDTLKREFKKIVIIDSDKKSGDTKKSVSYTIQSKDDKGIVYIKGDLSDTGIVKKLSEKGFTVITPENVTEYAKRVDKSDETSVIYLSSVQRDSLKKGDKSIRVRVKGGNKPVMVVNGEIVTEFDISKYSPESIVSVNILKDEAAIQKYGDKGKSGIIELTLRDGAGNIVGNNIDANKRVIIEGDNRSETLKSIMIINSKGGKEAPLVVIDGEVMKEKFDINTIKPETIHSMTVLKDKSAIEKYGERAKNGVIEVTLKK